jgi:glutamate formiminotransferase/formiminotetrahydrofolate cyclodeaminase
MGLYTSSRSMNQQALVECVPNFSEGRNMAVIKQITDAIESVEGVRLIDVDPGKDTNRTVVTFVGTPHAVCEAAFQGAKVAAEVIDMSHHKGEHPRMGAMDVCPLIPISGITMSETAELARGLGKRIAEELGIPVYLYEYSAVSDERKNLATLRAGEYEALADKLKKPEWKPDFGNAQFNAKSGASVVGARDFLVAYNVNLNTTSVRRANAIAFDVRERGRVKRDGDPLTGEILRDKDGEPIYEPGSLQSVKAIGWYIEEFGIAQLSMNLTNVHVTPVHVAFDEVVDKAQARGVRVTGSELVGLIPLEAMLEAGRHYLRKQRRSVGVSDRELVHIAARSLGLNDVKPFNPDEKIIEYAIADKSRKRLVDMTVEAFVEETASESAAPGGGSVSATLGALGAALATMVANLSSHKRGWDDRWEEFSKWAEKGKAYWTELTSLVDQDTDAFNILMDAFGLAKSTDDEKKARKQAIQAATKHAIEIPLQVMEVALGSMEVIQAMAEIGNPNSVSDAGVGALCARSAVVGAWLNVKINATSLEDKTFVESCLTRAAQMADQAQEKEAAILKIAEEKMQPS